MNPVRWSQIWQTEPVSCSNDWATIESYTQYHYYSREQLWQYSLLLLTKPQLRCGQMEFEGGSHLRDNGHQTYWGHDLDLLGSRDVIGQWPFDSRRAISYWWSFGPKSLSLAVSEIFRPKHHVLIDTIIEKGAVYHTVNGDPALFHTSKTAKMIKVILLRAPCQNVNVLPSNITFIIFAVFDVWNNAGSPLIVW